MLASASSDASPSTSLIKDMLVNMITSVHKLAATHEPLIRLLETAKSASPQAITDYVNDTLVRYKAHIAAKDVSFFASRDAPAEIAELRLWEVVELIPSNVIDETFAGLSHVIMLQTTLGFLPPALLQSIESAAGKVAGASTNGQIDPTMLAEAMTDLLGSLGMGSAMGAAAPPEDRIAKLKEARKKLI